MTILTHNPEAFTAEYDELQSLINAEPMPKRPTTSYETLRNHYRPMTLRERAEKNRAEEAEKHRAYCNNHIANKGQKLLKEAIEKSKQPKQLSLF
jgi:hypothetical protein